MTSTGTKTVLFCGSHNPEFDKDACGNPMRCLFEEYNWRVRGKHTDKCPPGVSVILHQMGMHLNDSFGDDARQALVRFLPNGDDRLAGTRDDGKDGTRGYMALDWLIRVHLPAWLDLAGLAADAAALRGLESLRTLDTARSAAPVVRQSRDKAYAAWDAAWGAAGGAAWDAAGAAAGAAAGDAARAASPAAAGAAAWDAAWDAARAAAGAAARAAARDAAWGAARAAAGGAAWDAARAAAGAAAGDAAGDAAIERCRPVVTELQASAIDLYDRMIRGTWDD